VTRNRLRPFTFLPASKPRIAAGTVSAVRTYCESIRPALAHAAASQAAYGMRYHRKLTRSYDFPIVRMGSSQAGAEAKTPLRRGRSRRSIYNWSRFVRGK
jgi:hypothetical protein